jgi:hypothetical protein
MQKQQQQLPSEPSLGGVFRGKVTGIMEFGCFVELQGFGHLGKRVSEQYSPLGPPVSVDAALDRFCTLFHVICSPWVAQAVLCG